jgi:hypothetical protein
MTAERRQASRIKTKLWIDLSLPKEKRRVQCTDVSRHGLFLEMDKPPDLGRIVLLKVQLPGGPFEAMATVARHGQFNIESMGGAGMKLYCLASSAKARWDKYVADVGGESFKAQERPSKDASTFLVQLQHVDQLKAFFQKHVAARQTVYITPPVRRMGAEILVVLVHPTTKEELTLRGAVCDLDPDRPLRMGVKLEDGGVVGKRRFDAFIAATANPVQDEGGSGTYSYVNPKLAAMNAAREAAESEQKMLSEVVEEPALELVDKNALFDFQWRADLDDEP